MISDFIYLHATDSGAKVTVRACEITAVEENATVVKETGGNVVDVRRFPGCVIHFAGRTSAGIETHDEVLEMIRNAEL